MLHHHTTVIQITLYTIYKASSSVTKADKGQDEIKGGFRGGRTPPKISKYDFLLQYLIT